MNKVVITKLPIASFSYYQWLVLGLYELARQNKIKLSFRINPFNYIVLFVIGRKLISGSLRRLVNMYHPHPSYNLEGYVMSDGEKYTFAYDSADSAFMINDRLLKKCDVYFKMQCPAEIDPTGFNLSSCVKIPYYNSDTNRKKRKLSTAIFAFQDKIKAAMVGPRRLSWGYSYKKLRTSYENMINAPISTDKKGFVMSYFGDAQGPAPVYNRIHPDFDLEWEIMGYYSEKINHPNEKRAIASAILNSLGDGYDGRVIIDENRTKHSELVVPYNIFTQHVSKFQYNLNISGFRMSIPNRFIESFMVGTAVVTDKLALKWYAPFGKCVVETVAMGYEINETVDWKQFTDDILNLPEVSATEIKEEYERKWSPIALASYVIDTVISCRSML